jgi:hypothetical protein
MKQQLVLLMSASALLLSAAAFAQDHAVNSAPKGDAKNSELHTHDHK